MSPFVCNLKEDPLVPGQSLSHAPGKCSFQSTVRTAHHWNASPSQTHIEDRGRRRGRPAGVHSLRLREGHRAPEENSSPANDAHWKPHGLLECAFSRRGCVHVEAVPTGEDGPCRTSPGAPSKGLPTAFDCPAAARSQSSYIQWERCKVRTLERWLAPLSVPLSLLDPGQESPS
jgi:hypothetical protein